MTFLLLTIFAQAGAPPQETSMPAQKIEALLFECRVGGTVDPKEKAVEALSKAGDDSLPVLIRALAGKYPERVARKIEEEEERVGVAYRGDRSSLGIEYWVGEALVKMGPRAVPALLEALPAQPGPTAVTASLLARIGDRRANPALLKLLQEKKRGWHVRAVAADGLRRLMAREAVPHLIDALEEASKEKFHSDMNFMADTLAKFTGQSFGLKLVPEQNTASKAGIIPAHYDLPESAAERRAAVELWNQWWKESGEEFLKQGK